MRRSVRRTLWLAAPALTCGCRSRVSDAAPGHHDTGRVGPAPQQRPAAAPPHAPREPRAPPLVVTDSSLALKVGEWSYRADIPFRYTNRSRHTAAIPGCRPPGPPELQWWDGSRWAPAYDVIESACLSPPFLIAPGAFVVDTLRVVVSRDGTGPTGRPFEPAWRGPRTSADYRLVWDLHDAAPRSTRDRYRVGPLRPLAARVSNTFRLTLAAP